MPNVVVPSIIRALHNIFASIWVGGMLVMVISFLPTIRREIKDTELQGSLMDAFMIRQRKFIYLGIVILIGSGMLLARFSKQTPGLFNFSNPYSFILSVKHTLVILAVVIALVRSIAFKNAASSKDRAKKKMSMALLLINTFVGIVILVLSSITAVIG